MTKIRKQPEVKPPEKKRRTNLSIRKPNRVRDAAYRNFIRLGLMILGPLAVVIAGGYYYVIGGQFVSTENAYVKADKIAIAQMCPAALSRSYFRE